MSLVAGQLPENTCYPANVQDLLSLFAQFLDAPEGAQEIYFQTSEPTNVPKGTGWFNSATSEFRVYGQLQGATEYTWNLFAIVKDSVDTDAIQNGAVTMEKLSTDVSTALSANTDLTSTSVLRLEEPIGGGSKAALFYIMGDGNLKVVGQQVNGKLGIGRATTLDNTALPKQCVFDPPLDGEKVVKVYSQLESTFVLTDLGHVYAAGSNYQGQLGLFPTLTDTTHAYVFMRLNPDNFSGKKVVQLAIGSGGGPYISCYALTDDGYVYVWGHNSAGQLGRGNTTVLNFPNPVGPELTSLDTRVTKIMAIGGGTGSTTVNVAAYALLSDGTVYSCGYNATGQLGRGATNSFVNLNVFTKIQTLADIPGTTDVDGNPVAITVKDIYGAGDLTFGTAFFQLSDGRLYSCGGNAKGQCGQNLDPATTANQKLPTPAAVQLGGATPIDLGSDGNKVVNVVAFDGTSTVFAILEQTTVDPDNADNTITVRSLVCWGYNADGVLGIGDTTDRFAAVSAGSNFTSGVTKVALGGNNGNPSVVVWKDDNTLWVAGNNQSGQLGVGNQTASWPTFKRVLVDKDTPVADVAFGANNYPSGTPQSVLQVLFTTGKVLVCGYDATGIGQLGVDASPSLATALQRVRF